jgi:hypothetical protein
LKAPVFFSIRLPHPIVQESDMTNIDHSSNAKPNTNGNVELTFDELETAAGGMRKSSGGNTSGVMFLVFTFKLVAVK